MSFAPSWDKQPDEVLTYAFSFATKLLPGDSIVAVNALTVPPGITASAPSIVGDTVTALISSGTDGQTYRVSCLVETVFANRLAHDVNVVVSDGQN